MVQEMLDFFEDHLGGDDRLVTGVHTGQGPLTSEDVGEAGIDDLVRSLEVGALRNAPLEAGEFTVSCSGHGATVLLAGEVDSKTVQAAGFRACEVDVPLTEVDLAETLIRRQPALDIVAGGLWAAYEKRGATLVIAHRTWGYAAERAGLPYLWLEPVEDLDDVLSEDPLWVHAPGMWWNSRGLQAQARGGDLSLLLDATRPHPPEAPPSPP
jgi:hypothetical protein